MAAKSIQRNPSGAYVYNIVVDGVVRYVGKGSGNRAESHIRIANGINRRRDAGEVVRTQKFYNRLAKAIRAGALVQHKIIASGLSTQDAFTREIEEISQAPDGQLWNMLSGGQGADSAHFKRMWRDPATRARLIAFYKSPQTIERKRALAAVQWSDLDARENNRERTKSQWADPIFRKKRLAAMNAVDSTERRRKSKEKLALKWQDAAFRSERVKLIRAACRTEEFLRKRSSNSKKMWAAPGARERLGRLISAAQMKSEKVKAVWKDPAYRHKQTISRRAAWTPERKEKQRADTREQWAAGWAYRKKLKSPEDGSNC